MHASHGDSTYNLRVAKLPCVEIIDSHCGHVARTNMGSELRWRQDVRARHNAHRVCGRTPPAVSRAPSTSFRVDSISRIMNLAARRTTGLYCAVH